jgi:2',3'-cyclic-nucleotide 2'-phosphodiesterase/3'-nucleotidase
VVTRGGVRVGVTGFTTPGVMVWDRAIVAAARARAPDRRGRPGRPAPLAAAADLRIALVHAGLASGSSYDTAGIGPENAAAVLATIDPKPHLVIVGHTHREIRDTVIDGVHFVQPGSWARSLSVVHVTLVRDGQGIRVVEIRPDLIPLGTVAESPRIVRRSPRRTSWCGRGRISRSAPPEPRLRRPVRPGRGHALLDVNEVQRRRTGSAAVGDGGLRGGRGLPRGGVRLGDVAGVYPYENTLRAVRVSGAQLRAFLEHSARYFRTWQPGAPVLDERVPGYNFDVVHGAEYVIDLSRPVGQRIGGLRVGGRVVAPDDSFTLALNSYRQEGAAGTMLRGAPGHPQNVDVPGGDPATRTDAASHRWRPRRRARPRGWCSRRRRPR